MTHDGESLAQLADEIRQILAAALASNERHDAAIDRLDERHSAEMQRLDERNIAETGRRDDLHMQEIHRRDDLHAHELDLIRDALETRDVIGQAKGVIMTTLSCSPDEAFNLLRQQSQHENRKLVVVAHEIANRAWQRPPPPKEGPAKP